MCKYLKKGGNSVKRIISFLLVFMLAFTGFINQANAASFTDTSQSYRFYDEINYLSNEGIINGFPDGRFGPDETVTRAAAAIMIGKSLNLDGTKGETKFPDVSSSAQASGYIQSAVDAGIISGFPDGTFKPDQAVTRGQLAIFLSRAFEFTGTSNQSFSDVTPSMSAYPYIQKLIAANITSGYPDGTFKPDQAVTRGQFSAFMARTLDDSFKPNLEDPKPDPQPKKDMKVHFINVGQGDSTLIQTPEGKNILIDAGIKSSGQKVVSFLKQKDVGKLDMIVATHPHADHIGGLIPVLNAFQVDKFVDSGKAHTSQTYLEMLTIIDNKNIPFEVATKGKVYTFDNGFKMTTIHADSSAANLNNASVSFKAEYNKVSFLLTGDAEKEAEAAMVNSGFNLSSTIYKAGHHGSNTSSTQAFINKVKPEATILSYGKGNSYGHPHDEVVNRLKAVGSKLYSTENGDITVTTNGTTYSIASNEWTPPVVKPNPEPEPEKPTPNPDPGTGFPVNINTADHERLKDIPGVGDAIAGHIIDHRNRYGRFTSKSQLLNVKQIGPKTYEKMKDYVSL